MTPEERLVEEMRRVMVEEDDGVNHVCLSHTYREILTNDCLLGRLVDMGVIKMNSEESVREWFDRAAYLIDHYVLLNPDALPEIRFIIGMEETPPVSFLVVEETGELLKLI